MPESITINDLDEATVTWIDEEAKKRGTNRETVALSLIRKGIKCAQGRTVLETYHDLDFLAGTWTEEQADEFSNAVKDFDAPWNQ